MCTSDTAAQLHVHRNTLLHRPNRIRKLTGLDPRQLLELVAPVGYVLRLADATSSPQASVNRAPASGARRRASPWESVP